MILSRRGLETTLKIPVEDFNFIADPDKERVARDLYKNYPEFATVGSDDPKPNLGRSIMPLLTPLPVKAIRNRAQMITLKATNDNVAAQIKAFERAARKLGSRAH